MSKKSTKTSPPESGSVAVAEQESLQPGGPVATPPPGGWPDPEPPKYPPTPTINANDPNALVAETPLAQTLPQAPPVPPGLPPPVAVAAPAYDHQKRWFKKVNVALPFFVKGKAVKFEALGGNIGVGVFDAEKDAEQIAAMDAAAEVKKGGIVPIDEDLYQDLKKNHPWTPLKRGSQPALRIWDSKPRGLSRPVAKESAALDSSAGGPRGSAEAVVAGVESAGKSPTAPASFAPAMKKKSEFKGPVLRPPASGQFRPEVPRV